MKHAHYLKDISHLKTLDVYRACQLFGVTDPAIQHAVKKLLCAGGRGAKTYEQDLREAVDSINRALQMIAEDCNQQPTKPTKTGRDLYQAHMARDFAPQHMPKWCELSDEDQADWNAKAEKIARVETQARIHHASFGAGRVPPKADNAEMLASLTWPTNGFAQALYKAFKDIGLVMPDNGWIEWAGGDCPVDGEQTVHVRFRDAGESITAIASQLRWGHAGPSNTYSPSCDITAYRIAKEQS